MLIVMIVVLSAVGVDSLLSQPSGAGGEGQAGKLQASGQRSGSRVIYDTSSE